jgi:hypothetical protein
MYKGSMKTLAVAVAFGLTNVSGATLPDKQGAEDDQPVTVVKLKKPNRYHGLIQTNKQVYYSGEELDISVVIPEQLTALLEEAAELQLLIYSPDGKVKAFPVMGDGKFLETTETSAIAAGNYQLALVLTKRGGNAVNVGDWYNGFAGLVNTSRLKINDGFPGTDDEDADGDGVIDDDIDSDGFSDSDDEIVELSGTLPIVGATDKSALTRPTETHNTSIDSTVANQGGLKPLADVNNTTVGNVIDSLSSADHGKLKQSTGTGTPADSKAVDSVSVRAKADTLKPPVSEAIKLLFGMRIPVEECYAVTGKPCSPKILTYLSGKYVANITLAPDKLPVLNPTKYSYQEFSYQALLKTESEGIEKALAGKTIRITYEPGTEVWRCSPGNPNGVAQKYLPIECRH